MNETIRKYISVVAALMIVAGIFSFDVPYTAYAQAKKPAKVKISSARLSGTKIAVKWKKAKNAKKYQVYVKAGVAKWKKVRTLKTRLYKFKAVKDTLYWIKVRGVNGKKTGKFSAVKKVRGPESKEDPVDPEPAVKIVTQPADTTVKDGETAEFSITAEGQDLTYQWFRSSTSDASQGTRLSGETSSELEYKATILDNGIYFFCIVTSGTEKVKTTAARLTVEYGDRAYIISQSGDIDVMEGEAAEASVEARGGGTLTYQWYTSESSGNQGGDPVEGETGAVLRFRRLYLENNGRYYYCVVTNTSTADGKEVVTSQASRAIKVSVEPSPVYAEVKENIKALVDEYGVMTTNTVSIDGLDFYVIAHEDGRALLLAKQPSSYYEHSISDNDRWDCNYEGINFDGEGSCYVDDEIDDEMSGHYGAIVELNTDYLDKNPTIDCIADSVKTYTLKGGDFTMSEPVYFCLTKKVFILTQGDVTGMYAGENSAPYDYTFNLSQHWTHFGNPMPKEIVDMYVDGELVPWFVRSPYYDWNEDWTPGIVKADPDNIIVEGISDDDTVKAYARPAFWVEIG